MRPLNSIKAFTAIIVSIALCMSCGGKNGSAEDQATDAPSTNVAETLPGNFYKRMEGTIANQPVVMQLQCYNGTLQGSYYYLKQGKTLSLAGKLDSLHPNNFQLTEMDGNSEEDNNPKLDCVYEAGSIKGSWRSADGTKSYVIDLKEAYPAGSMKFRVVSLEEEAQAIPGVDSSPVATVTKHILIPENNDNWLSGKIAKMIGGDSIATATDITGAAKTQSAVFIRNFRADVKEAKADGFEISERFGYDDFLQLSVMYNENGFVIIDDNFYGYTGGAHGYGGDVYTCFDVQGKKQLEVYDILSADSVQLQPIVEAAFRRDRNLKPTDSLNEFLFENHLATTKNFYFTPMGIGFNYLPYEVASYADGSIFVFVPYTDLRKYIQPWFAERMHLDR